MDVLVCRASMEGPPAVVRCLDGLAGDLERSVPTAVGLRGACPRRLVSVGGGPQEEPVFEWICSAAGQSDEAIAKRRSLQLTHIIQRNCAALPIRIARSWFLEGERGHVLIETTAADVDATLMLVDVIPAGMGLVAGARELKQSGRLAADDLTAIELLAEVARILGATERAISGTAMRQGPGGVLSLLPFRGFDLSELEDRGGEHLAPAGDLPSVLAGRVGYGILGDMAEVDHRAAVRTAGQPRSDE